ncbi:hypothetical protein N9Y00_10875 [Tateyamaria sp.]|nr:hypothetical protein [Tateyamaria sp.]
MNTEFLYEPQLHRDLQIGDIVACCFPHKVERPNDPKVRPSLVLDIVENAGGRFALLAYGTSQSKKLRGGYLIPVEYDAEIEAASLRAAMVFDGRRRLLVSLRNAAFELRRKDNSPIIGRLKGVSAAQMQNVRARIHANRDIKRDRQAAKMQAVTVEYREKRKLVRAGGVYV